MNTYPPAATPTANINTINTILARAPTATRPPLMVATDILPHDWWRGDGLEFWASRCSAHFRSSPARLEVKADKNVEKGKLAEALDDAWLEKYDKMSNVARSWLKASHRYLIDPAALEEANKESYGREYARLLDTLAAVEIAIFEKSVTRVHTVLTIFLAVLMTQMIALMVLVTVDKVPSIGWYSFGILITVCLAATISAAVATITIRRGLTPTYGDHFSSSTTIGRGRLIVCSDPGWSWVLVMCGLSSLIIAVSHGALGLVSHSGSLGFHLFGFQNS